MTNIRTETGDDKPRLTHGAHYAKTLFDRHGIESRGRTDLVGKLLGLAYSPAHRRVRGVASWTFEELEKVASYFGETVEDVILAAANEEAESGTFLCGPIRARCKFWIGSEIVAPRRGALVALRTADGWLVTAASDEHPDAAAYSLRQVIIDTSVSGCRIAVLDDDRGITESVCEYLRKAGFAADPFSSIATITAAIQERPYDAYILDWLIGSTNVRDLIANLRRDSPDCPIAVLTGQGDAGTNITSDIAETLATQRVLFFEKPIRSRILTATLTKLLSGLPRA